jgi:zinc transport system substrate-binding protein
MISHGEEFMKWSTVTFSALCVLLVTNSVPPAMASEPISVFVSILPQKTFVEKIGGDRVHVSVLVEPGGNPHTYEPKPRQMAALSKAKIFFAIGVTFEEAWLDRIAALNKDMRIVHTEEGIERRRMVDHRQAGKSPDHDHASADPHVWLSPPLVMLQARNILQALTEVDPAGRDHYERNYKGFIDEIVDLDAELMATFAQSGGPRTFMVFHPSWGYFAEAYGLKQVAVEHEGKEPKPRELRDLVEFARKRDIAVIFVQPQYSRKSAEAIAREIGAQVAVADPLAEDWAQNLRAVAGQFKKALK